MSAIAGILYLDRKPVEQNHLTKMLDILTHRGSDGANIWSEENVGFIHRMLWTTPESLLETLPLEKNNLVITADARIDNRNELISALELNNLPKEKITDSDLILAAYQKWGDRCPAKLIGDFAFAIWDKREQTLFCARDPMGVKPFYYCRSGNLFVFASEIKALFTLPEVPCHLNEPMVADYLAKILFNGRKEDSFYQDIVELYGAESLIISPSKMQVQSYWSPDLNYELNLSSDEEYVEAFREIFIEAVRCRLRSAFPVGSALSGGLDSSSISCVVNQILSSETRGELQTFSAIFPSLAADYPKIDERPYINTVATKPGIKANFVYADCISPFVDLDRVFWHGEEPSPAPNLYMDWSVFKEAQQQGVRVLLTGSDGDTTVTYGVQHLAELAATFRWKKLIEEGTAFAKVKGGSSRHTIWKFGIEPVIPQSISQTWRQLRGRQPIETGLNIEQSTVLNPAFAKQMKVAERFDEDIVPPVWGNQIKNVSRKEHWLDLHSGSVKYALQWLDKTAGAFSLEARHPFCDRRLIEFCLALPSGQKLYRGWSRSILRRAMEGILPSEIQWRNDKGDLSSNFKLRLLQDERKTLEQAILGEPEIIEKYVDIAKLQASYRRYCDNFVDCDRESVDIFVAVNLALWLKQSGIKL
jgi:asparagine synthase (glutamine-hydrolysing)